MSDALLVEVEHMSDATDVLRRRKMLLEVDDSYLSIDGLP
jgi:hypothetical protein